MAVNAYYLNQFISTTLSTVGGIDDSQTTGIKIASVSGIDITKPGIACLSYSDPLLTASAEWITFTSIDGTNELQGVTRGAEGYAAKAHSNGVTVAFPISKSHINNLNDALIIDGVETNLADGVLDEDDMATNSATKIPTQQSVKAYVDLRNNSPEGFLINGKIVPSVASNNLTVAIKGMDGNDPSASNPVYVRIGDVVRTITSALSWTKNAGTNYGGAGDAAFATKEIDWFVYLVWSTADDAVKLAVSRKPDARLMSDFSSTVGAWNYRMFDGTATAGDSVVNIGRFAATLSAGAGYTWTVPAFTNANLIQHPIFETRQLTWLPVIKGDGTAGTGTYSTQAGYYKIIGGKVDFVADMTWSNITGSPTGSLAGSIPLTANAGTEQTLASLNFANVTFPAGTIQMIALMTATDTMVHFYGVRDGATNIATTVDTAGTVRYGGSYAI